MKHVMQGSRQRGTNLGATLCSLSRLRGAHGNAPTARQKIHTDHIDTYLSPVASTAAAAAAVTASAAVAKEECCIVGKWHPYMLP